MFKPYTLGEEDKNIVCEGYIVNRKLSSTVRGGKKKKELIKSDFLVVAAGRGEKCVGKIRTHSITFPENMIGKKVRLHVEVLDE